MAKRRTKKRTHTQATEEEVQATPRSMVLKLGAHSKPTPSLTSLVKDVRAIMQPHTATRLKERKANKLKDFLVMAGPLGVSHLMLFSQSEQGNVNLRIARTPRGPTLCFKVLSYSLSKDIRKITRRPKSLAGADFAHPPLLVMNNFTTAKSENKKPEDLLMTSMFQNMFPPISAQSSKPSAIRRVLMITKNSDTGYLELRHYAIDTQAVDVSKGVKRLLNAKRLKKNVPNLGKRGDVSELLLDNAGAGFTSESELDDDAIVSVAQSSIQRPVKKELTAADDNNSIGTTKRAVKLTEVGPRMCLQLVKIEEGVCDGKILHHAYIKKTPKEIKEMEKKVAAQQKLKAIRRKEQEENVKRKLEAKAQVGGRMKRGAEKAKLAATAEGSADEASADAKSDNEEDMNVEEMSDYDLELADAKLKSDDEEMSE
ncbi:Brix-domain-containing protein [Nadsonia fulvescens var. elongata DSM 6958]|uniref:Brix-domain-containing protein n=1 Tax=Nadsonia fulvescens var. elongata DSM 6958 TaxID=857566 RepID=A0A1E3PL49_9ASCO|nr:Brix-domain-containing protein [Nadsonia fulvescens var. elongata DSM 6958]